MNSNQPKSFSNQSSSWEGLAILEPSGSLSWGRDHWTAVVPGLALDSMEDKQVAVYPQSAVFLNHDMICLYVYIYLFEYKYLLLFFFAPRNGRLIWGSWITRGYITLAEIAKWRFGGLQVRLRETLKFPAGVKQFSREWLGKGPNVSLYGLFPNINCLQWRYAFVK